MLCGVLTPIVPPINKACGVSPPSEYIFSPILIVPPVKRVCVVSPRPPQCISVPLPHSARSWILSEIENLASSSLSVQLSSPTCRPANNGVSWYPSYQHIFRLEENFQNNYRTLSKLDKFSLNFLSILQNFL